MQLCLNDMRLEQLCSSPWTRPRSDAAVRVHMARHKSCLSVLQDHRSTHSWISDPHAWISHHAVSCPHLSTQEGLANLVLVGGSISILKAKVEASLPRKRGAAALGYDKVRIVFLFRFRTKRLKYLAATLFSSSAGRTATQARTCCPISGQNRPNTSQTRSKTRERNVRFCCLSHCSRSLAELS